MFSEVVLASEQRTRTRRFVAGVSPALLNGGHFARPRPFAARTSKGPGFKFGCASFLSLLSSPLLQKRAFRDGGFLQKHAFLHF